MVPSISCERKEMCEDLDGLIPPAEISLEKSPAPKRVRIEKDGRKTPTTLTTAAYSETANSSGKFISSDDGNLILHSQDSEDLEDEEYDFAMVDNDFAMVHNDSGPIKSMQKLPSMQQQGRECENGLFCKKDHQPILNQSDKPADQQPYNSVGSQPYDPEAMPAPRKADRIHSSGAKVHTTGNETSSWTIHREALDGTPYLNVLGGANDERDVKMNNDNNYNSCNYAKKINIINNWAAAAAHNESPNNWTMETECPQAAGECTSTRPNLPNNLANFASPALAAPTFEEFKQNLESFGKRRRSQKIEKMIMDQEGNVVTEQGEEEKSTDSWLMIWLRKVITLEGLREQSVDQILMNHNFRAKNFDYPQHTPYNSTNSGRIHSYQSGMTMNSMAMNRNNRKMTHNDNPPMCMVRNKFCNPPMKGQGKGQQPPTTNPSTTLNNTLTTLNNPSKFNLFEAAKRSNPIRAVQISPVVPPTPGTQLKQILTEVVHLTKHSTGETSNAGSKSDLKSNVSSDASSSPQKTGNTNAGLKTAPVGSKLVTSPDVVNDALTGSDGSPNEALVDHHAIAILNKAVLSSISLDRLPEATKETIISSSSTKEKTMSFETREGLSAHALNLTSTLSEPTTSAPTRSTSATSGNMPASTSATSGTTSATSVTKSASSATASSASFSTPSTDSAQERNPPPPLLASSSGSRSSPRQPSPMGGPSRREQVSVLCGHRRGSTSEHSSSGQSRSSEWNTNSREWSSRSGEWQKSSGEWQNRSGECEDCRPSQEWACQDRRSQEWESELRGPHHQDWWDYEGNTSTQSSPYDYINNRSYDYYNPGNDGRHYISNDYINGNKGGARDTRVNGGCKGGKEETVEYEVPKNHEKQNGFSILVKNLSPESDTNEVRKIFETVGDVVDVYLPMRYNNNHVLSKAIPKGYGFVEFQKKEDAMKAIKALNGVILRARTLALSEAHAKRKTTEDMKHLYHMKQREKMYTRN